MIVSREAAQQPGAAPSSRQDAHPPRQEDSLCSIADTLAVIGDRWTVLILRDIFRGAHRFSELENGLGIAKNLLSNRLGRLVNARIIEKVPYQERPTRYDYRLTERGRDLSPTLIALMNWGDRWMADDGPPTVLVHDVCNTALNLHVWCRECNADVDPTHIRSRPGPGRCLEEEAP